MKIKTMRLALGLAVFGCLLVSNASIIDFEDVAVAPGVNDIGGDFSSGGFLFNSALDHRHLVNAPSWGPDNGSTYAVFDDFLGVAVTFVSTTGPFSLTSVDLAGVNGTDAATSVNFLGYVDGGGFIAQTFFVTSSFQTFNFSPTWTSTLLTQVQMDGDGTLTSYYGIDNIGVIPEPASFSLIGLVAGGIYFVRRFFRA